MQNFGFFIAALLRQNPLCTLSRGDHSFSIQENDYCRDLKVLFDCSLDIRMTGICSAVAGSPQLEKLSIGRWINRNYPGVERMRHCYWGWLGFALSNDSIQQLKITGVDLGQRGVALFEAALKHKYPEPVLSTLSSPQYGYIKVRAGTMLNSRGWGDADRTSFALLHDCRCRALFDPFTTKSEVNVVVPGHGICSLKLTDQASGFVPDRVAKSSTLSGSSSRLQSLKLNIATCQSGAALTNLLELIGSNLLSLSIAVLEPNQVVSVDMAALAGACTKLEDLCLERTSVSASVFNEAVCDWGLRKIVLRASSAHDNID
ncbi:hypothetical protein PR002_g23968 [Phytophthora rubi]|uniref:Uncharacterized protein n=1 Tax=Phytophthora rubi TaxID=129364 RepID=A0A6A3IHB1_9STRA|nr:hypothetical protein PR002_g23968 [Phytophthora rubi]